MSDFESVGEYRTKEMKAALYAAGRQHDWEKIKGYTLDFFDEYETCEYRRMGNIHDLARLTAEYNKKRANRLVNTFQYVIGGFVTEDDPTLQDPDYAASIYQLGQIFTNNEFFDAERPFLESSAYSNSIDKRNLHEGVMLHSTICSLNPEVVYDWHCCMQKRLYKSFCDLLVPEAIYVSADPYLGFDLLIAQVVQFELQVGIAEVLSPEQWSDSWSEWIHNLISEEPLLEPLNKVHSLLADVGNTITDIAAQCSSAKDGDEKSLQELMSALKLDRISCKAMLDSEESTRTSVGLLEFYNFAIHYIRSLTDEYRFADGTLFRNAAEETLLFLRLSIDDFYSDYLRQINSKISSLTENENWLELADFYLKEVQFVKTVAETYHLSSSPTSEMKYDLLFKCHAEDWSSMALDRYPVYLINLLNFISAGLSEPDFIETMYSVYPKGEWILQYLGIRSLCELFKAPYDKKSKTQQRRTVYKYLYSRYHNDFMTNGVTTLSSIFTFTLKNSALCSQWYIPYNLVDEEIDADSRSQHPDDPQMKYDPDAYDPHDTTWMSSAYAVLDSPYIGFTTLVDDSFILMQLPDGLDEYEIGYAENIKENAIIFPLDAEAPDINSIQAILKPATFEIWLDQQILLEKQKKLTLEKQAIAESQAMLLATNLLMLRRFTHLSANGLQTRAMQNLAHKVIAGTATPQDGGKLLVLANNVELVRRQLEKLKIRSNRDSETMRRELRESIVWEDGDTICQIVDQSLEMLLFRVFYEDSARIQYIRKKLVALDLNFDVLITDFENQIIHEETQENAVTQWFEQNIISIPVEISEDWKMLRFEKNGAFQDLLIEILTELFVNFLSHGDIKKENSCWLTLGTEGETEFGSPEYLTIKMENAVSEEGGYSGGKTGLDSLKELLDLINTSSERKVHPSLKSQNDGKTFAIMLWIDADGIVL